MLTEAELTSMRSLQAHTLDQVATVTRRTVGASDGAGGWETVEATAKLPCRVAPASFGQVQMLGGRAAELQVWRATFAAGADVRTNDKIAVAGKQLEVQAVLGGESRETARVAIAIERV